MAIINDRIEESFYSIDESNNNDIFAEVKKSNPGHSYILNIAISANKETTHHSLDHAVVISICTKTCQET